MRRALVLLAVVALLVPLSASAARDKAFGSDSIPCGDNGTISWTPTTLWPPNHKLHDVTFTYHDPDGGTSELTITATEHSDVVGGEELNGSGNTDPATDSLGGADAGTDGEDAVVVGNARAERSGHSKQGREYNFGYVAMNDGGTPSDPSDDDGCSGPDSNEATDDEIIVTVPHDCRNGACKP